MTDALKPTEAAARAGNEALKAMRASSDIGVVTEALKTITGELRVAAAMFNATRARFETFAKLFNSAKVRGAEVAKTFEALQKGDYGLLLCDADNLDPKTVRVDDAALFAETLKRVVATKLPHTRFAACIEANDAVAEAIARWESKISKMRSRTVADGSSAAEAGAAAAKTAQFEEAVATLKRRGAMVSDVFYESVREVERLVADAKARFKAIYPKGAR